MKLHRIAVAVSALALVVPAAVSAKGKPETAKSKSKSEHVAKGKSKPKTFLFKGTWVDESSSVTVTGGNSRVRKGGFRGESVVFDFAAAAENGKLKVAESDGVEGLTADDFVDGDKLVVQARLPRATAAADGLGPFEARKAVDQTHPKAEEADEEEEVEVEPVEPVE